MIGLILPFQLLPHVQQKQTEVIQMREEEKFTPKPPEYKGDGISIWKATDKNNKIYLKVKVLNTKPVNCFKFEPKEHKQQQQDW